jgi:hypothetical protein
MTKARIRIDSWWFLKCCAFDTLLNVRLTETNSTVGFLLWEQRKSRYWVRFDQNSKAMSWRHTPKEQKPIGKRDQQLQSGKHTVMQRKIARPSWYEIDMQYLLALTFLYQCLQRLGNVLATGVFSWPTNRETSRDWIYGFGCEARSSGRDTPAETMFPSELLSSSSRISPGPGRVWAIVGHCRSDRRNFPTAGGTRPVPCKRWLEIRRQGRC